MTDPRNPPSREDIDKIYDHMPKEYFVSFVRALWFDGYDAGYDQGYRNAKDMYETMEGSFVGDHLREDF